MQSVIANTFKLSWATGLIIFIKTKNSTTLVDSFEEIRHIIYNYTESTIIRTSLDIQKILLDTVLSSNSSDVEYKLTEICDNIITLINMLPDLVTNTIS